MDTGLLVAILIVLVLLVVLALVAGRQRRSRRLRERFGPEYDRTVAEAGDRREAEAKLQERTERRQQLDIVALDPAARDRYVEAWRQTQARFVDEPAEATREADRLITEVMRERGYPVEDFEQRAADVSVDHPQVVDDYRAAHAIAAANERSEASTEDLRQALVHYRSLFEELLEVGQAEPRRQPYDGRAEQPTEEAR
jgi:FtsZ-interacting cell division protein ZipA